jgi:hypothetical protein
VDSISVSLTGRPFRHYTSYGAYSDVGIPSTGCNVPRGGSASQYGPGAERRATKRLAIQQKSSTSVSWPTFGEIRYRDGTADVKHTPGFRRPGWLFLLAL